MKRIVWIFGFAAVVVTAFALAQRIRPSVAMSTGDNSVSDASVKIDNFSFGPATVTIPVGTTDHLDELRRRSSRRHQ